MKINRRMCIVVVSIIATVVLLVALPGCGNSSDETEMCDLSGTITFGGKPVPDGLITFEPDASKGNKGRAGSAVIRNGRFDTRDNGRGVSPGVVVVRIVGFDGVNLKNSDSGHGRPLFSEFKITRDITANNKTIDYDVPSGKRR